MADDTNTAEREAVARAIWALMREHEDRCDEELEDLSRYHPVWEYADAARASLAASAGSEPGAWRLRNTAFRSEVYEYFKTKYLAECRQKQFNASVDDGGLHDLTPLYTHPSPTEGMAGWISVDERLPEPGQNVAFVVRANICGSFRLLNGRVLGGRFLPGEGFSIPGLCVDASHWMPLPAPPLPASEAKEL